MSYSLSYKGRKIELGVSGAQASLAEVRKLLHQIKTIDSSSEPIVQHVNTNLLLEDDLPNVDWWDLPQDLLHNRETAPFISMESDLNAGTHYEKVSFSLQVIVDDQGKKMTLDRESLKKSLQKASLNERSSKANAALARVKGSLSADFKPQIEDFLKKQLQIDRIKLILDKKQYGERASLELVLFGDFQQE